CLLGGLAKAVATRRGRCAQSALGCHHLSSIMTGAQIHHFAHMGAQQGLFGPVQPLRPVPMWTRSAFPGSPAGSSASTPTKSVTRITEAPLEVGREETDQPGIFTVARGSGHSDCLPSSRSHVAFFPFR